MTNEEKKAMREEMSDLTDELKRFKFYFEDDPTTGKKGIIHKIESIENRMKDVELRLKVWDIRLATIGGIAGIIGSALAFGAKLLISAFK